MVRDKRTWDREREREFFSFEKKEEHLKTILFGKIEIESTVTI